MTKTRLSCDGHSNGAGMLRLAARRLTAHSGSHCVDSDDDDDDEAAMLYTWDMWDGAPRHLGLALLSGAGV